MIGAFFVGEGPISVGLVPCELALTAVWPRCSILWPAMKRALSVGLLLVLTVALGSYDKSSWFGSRQIVDVEQKTRTRVLYYLGNTPVGSIFN